MPRKRMTGKAMYFTGWIINGKGILFSSVAEAKKYLESEITGGEKKHIGRDIDYFKEGVNTARVPFMFSIKSVKYGKKIKL